MKKLAFLIAAWLVHVPVLSFSDSFDVADADIEKLFDRISEEMLLSLTNSLSTPLSRQKREIGALKQSVYDDSGVYRLKSVRPVSKLCYPAIQTLFLDVSNTTYAVCVSALTLDNPAEVVIGYYKEHAWTPIHRWFVDNPAKAVAFHFKNHIYVLVAESDTESGTKLVKINLRTNSLDTDHSVTSNYATSIAVWHMKIKGTYNLAIANTNGYKDASNLSSEVFVYEWKGTYFDRYSVIKAFDVKDIEPFHIHDAAYIAVANFRRGKNNYRVDSEILRYNLDSRKWVSHQKIRTYGAMDWEFFSLGTSLGQEFFLALANKGLGDVNDRSMIYKFVSDKFVPFQCLQTTRATSLASFSDGEMFILAVANEDDAVYLYQYDGWQFVRSDVQMTSGAMSVGVKHLELHKVTRNSENVLILSVSNPRQAYYPSVFEIGLVHENALQDWREASTEWCLNTLKRIESTDIDKTIGNLDDVIFTDEASVTINGDLVFEEGFVADTLRTPKLTEISTKEIFDSHLLGDLADLQRRLDEIKQKLDGFSVILNNSLKIEGNQTITNRLEFQDAEFHCTSHSCHFENIYTSVLNQETINDWQSQLVFLDSEQIIDGTLWAEEINVSSLHVLGLIDGVNSQNLVTKSGNHFITGYKSFNNLISANDIAVSGKVDGVTISPVDVLITTGHQTLHGEISFEAVNTTWLSAGYVNGKNFTEFYHDLVLTDKPYTITGQKTFMDVTIGELVMTPGSTINGVDIMDLWKNALWIDGKQEITAGLTFSDVMFKNIRISSGINGIQIPGPRIVDITENAYITAPQIFTNSTKIGYLEIQDSLNGISVVEAPDGSKLLEIMLKTGDQIVKGLKTFRTINLGDNSDVGGTVDGVDLSEFKASVLRKNSDVIADGTWVFKNMTVKGPLTVEGTVSGVRLEDVYRRALKLNESSLPEMEFQDVVHVKDLQSNNINGINVLTDLVLKNQEQTLMGDYVFSEIVIEENAEILGLVNGEDFSFLKEVLLRIGDQRIKSRVFKRDVKVRNLTIKGTINNVAVTDIVTLKGGQIWRPRSLNNVTFSDINAKNVEVAGNVNKINLREMIEDTMTYDGKEIVTGVKDINGTVYILNGTDIETKDLNGFDFKMLWEDAVLVDTPQEITGTKTFENNVVFNNLSFSGTFDGVSDWEMKYNWMLTDAPQTVEGDVVFQNGFTGRDLITNTVNGLSLKDLESEIVKVNEETEISGTVVFENAVLSYGDVSLTGKIQGIDLSEEAVSRDKIIVTAPKTFSQDLVIKGDLTVDGNVDGVRVEDLCNQTFLRNKDVNISRLVIKGDVTLLDEGIVGGSIAGVSLSLFKEIALKNKGPEIKFEGKKTFSNLTLAGPVTLKGKFGDVNLRDLYENYMSVTRDQEIPARMTFDDLSFQGILSVANLDTANKKINDINLQQLNDRILRTRGTQNITALFHIDEVYFASDVFVAGKVNGLRLPDGLMRHNHTNYIRSPKIFEQAVVVQGDLDMEEGKTIQDVDVSYWFRKAVLKHGKFHIQGLKTFNKLDLYDVKAEDKFDGLEISEGNLLMTYGDQVVTKRKLVKGSVDIEGSLTVNGLINNVNLTLLSAETLQRDRNNTVTGLKYFNQPLTIVSLEAPTVAGIDIGLLKGKLNTTLELNHLENHLEKIEGVVTHMQTAFDNQAVLLQYYEIFNEFDISSVYDFLYVSGQDCGELLLMSDNSGSSGNCSSVRIFGYDETAQSFEPTRQELLTSYAVSVKSLTLNDVTHLFVSNRNPCCSCTRNLSDGSTIDIYSWKVAKFEILQSLEVHEPIDMVAFKDGSTACLVVLEIEGSKVYCASGSNPNFNEKEVLSTTGGQKVSVVQSSGRTILAIAAEDAYNARVNYVEGESFIDIYVWNPAKAEFTDRKQLLQSTSAQSIALTSHTDGSVFLVIAEGILPKIHNEPKLLVYRFKESSDKFEKYQEIKDYGILEWINLKTGELIFFAVDSEQGQIKVYQLKGVSGFVKIDTIKSLGVKRVLPFIRSDPEDSLNHYLALAGRNCKELSTRNVYYAKILKSKLKGRRPIY